VRRRGRESERNGVKMEVEREREEWCEDGGREREREEWCEDGGREGDESWGR
jgi:hypothetical protein